MKAKHILTIIEVCLILTIIAEVVAIAYKKFGG